ncbi:MAG: peroxiredoxin family protein [Deltaproteobacteria bacterium]|nr:peroxiredoxin family protein [Deltaproteobacteria bacterium]
MVGVSSDSLPTQCEFAQAHGVRFPMIADPDRAIARAYDVLFTFLPIAHRVTYVLDRRGTIAGVFKHEFQVLKHLDEVTRFVQALARQKR